MSNFKYKMIDDNCYLIIGEDRIKVKWEKRWVPESETILSYATGITIDNVPQTLDLGKTYQLETTTTPEKVLDTWVWSSSDETIATVSATGLLTGLKIGNTTIKVESKEHPEISATCSIIVDESLDPGV